MSIEISINGKKGRFPHGTLLLEAARQLGFEIPTLCYQPRLNQDKSKNTVHSSSCSVCLVFDTENKHFLTACDTRITGPLTIQTDNPEIIQARKESLELLLCEHIGDCLGPCVMACPFGIDIPELLKQAWLGNSNKTRNLLALYLDDDDFPCQDCEAPCIKSCRRKQIDQPLPIPEILLGLFQREKDQIKTNQNQKKPRLKQKSVSTTGRIKTEADKDYHLRRSLEAGYLSGKNAPKQAGPCLQCSCAAREHCALRGLADQHQARAGSFKVQARPEIPAAEIYGKMIFQPGKCVHCRACERLAGQQRLAPVPRVWHRGPESRMSFGSANYTGEEAQMLAGICPTGAISLNDKDRDNAS